MRITPFQALACPLDGTPLHCTGSAWRLPVLSGTLDRVLCVFGFPVYPEFAQVSRLIDWPHSSTIQLGQ